MSLPDAPADIKGTITEIDEKGMLVEANPRTTEGTDKAFVKVTDETAIQTREGKAMKAKELEVGQIVSVWFTGPVNQSYPLRATAATVVVE